MRFNLIVIKNKLFNMSVGKLSYRKKGTNCNKPYREFGHGYSDGMDKAESKGKEQYLGKNRQGCLKSIDLSDFDKLLNSNVKSPRERSNVKNTYSKPHPWLKGKEIGLWYKNQRLKEKAADEQVSVELDDRKKKEIKEALALFNATLSSSEKEELKQKYFNQGHSNKKSLTFEEKLERAPVFTLEPDEKLDRKMYKDFCNRKHDKKFEKMLCFRQKLPIYDYASKILNLIYQNQIILICGSTGCGKTTQAIQYVMDDYILNCKGSLCTAVCTQPRRISAVSVSERVAAERAERIGENVGYVIRLESVLPQRKRGTITFVTTGILIEWLKSDPTLPGISHLFIDEIHERDTLCDFLITLIKFILPKRPDLRVILMSATMNAEKFSEYFGGIPYLEIPGFTYPVEEFYLEDILEKVKFNFSSQNQPSHKVMFPPDKTFSLYVAPYIRNLEMSGRYSRSVINNLHNPESELLNVELITAVIHYICLNEGEGAILVFVPGLSAIQDLHKCLLKRRYFRRGNILIIPLHSILPTIKQKKIFDRPPQGVRKIIISTPIAETSVTIDDVVFVIDSGKCKLNNYNTLENVDTLECTWETLANSTQRKGRAGRTQSGKCYKLFTKARESTFEQYPLPEIQRTHLAGLILNAKTFNLGHVAPFLEKTMDPPDSKAVELSLKMLRTINALDNDECLTPLGFSIAKLPMDPQTGKMILMGALFRCLDPILSIAVCLSFKDPFVFLLQEEHNINRKRNEFSRNESSDHYMFSEVIREWEEAVSDGYGCDFAYENYLSKPTLHLLRNMKKQIACYLKNMNFIVNDDPKHPDNNINSNNPGLIKAVVCSGLYPNVATKKSGSGMGVVFRTIDHSTVKLHKKSVIQKSKSYDSPFLVYFKKVKYRSILLHDATVVNPVSLLLFGENFEVTQETKCIVRVDAMLKFLCDAETADLIQNLRNKLIWIFEKELRNQKGLSSQVNEKKSILLDAITKLFTQSAQKFQKHK